ncbi:hypothetical protein BDF14DRAFT_1992458 [Spinellus fusiger]|nr:hypothetical protein BDF14DRAFT_1992458 [Spinellus fusiger]
MVLCKFFQEGRCQRGNNCNFEHTLPNGVKGKASGAVATEKYNERVFSTSLNEERPVWRLSVFGPAKEEPNLIVGTDRSQEEDRALYYASMRTTGNPNQFITNHEEALKAMETQVNAILSNTKEALNHYEAQKAKHTGGSFGTPTTQQFEPFVGSTGAFGQQASTGAFGNTNGCFGSSSSALGGAGRGAFGQPSSMGGGAFGQQPTTSAFGTTSALGGGGAFGQTSSMGTSAFGQTSSLGTSTGGGAFGQKPTASAFGTTSTLGGAGTGAFGQPSAMGASAFGQPSTTGASAFGQPSAMGASAFTPPQSIAQTPATTNTSTQPNSSISSQTGPLAKNDPAWIAFQASEFEMGQIPELEPPIDCR